jgi:hypothetical protein
MLTRFGPLFQIERMGGQFVLAALQVPEARFDARHGAGQRAARGGAQLPARTRAQHVVRAGHRDAARRPGGLARIERETGLKVHAFPKEREYFVEVAPAAAGPEPLRPEEVPCADAISTAPDRRHPGRPAAGAAPLRRRGRQLGVSGEEVRERLAQLLDDRPDPPHRRRAQPLPAGLHRQRHERVGRGRRARRRAGRAGRPRCFGVSHCYRRPRACRCGPTTCSRWCTAAAATRSRQQAEQIAALLGDACRGHDILYSSAHPQEDRPALSES